MKGLLEILAARELLPEPAVLATLVRVKGSSYRKPGARMLVRAGGAQTGVISAGCLETDLRARVAGVLASQQPQLASFDLGSELDLIWGTGMGCQGKAEVLLEPVAPGPPAPWMSQCRSLLADRRCGVLATVYAARGGALDARVGDRFLVAGAGPGPMTGLDPTTGTNPMTGLDPTTGTNPMTGPDLSPAPGPFATALGLALAETLALGTARSHTLASGPGELDLLLEPILPPYALWIFGAGEHARPLARLAHELGWWVGILDHRPALATAERFPEAFRIVLGHPPESLLGLPFDARSAALVVSHVYEQDRQAMAALLQQPLGYLGLQGNRNRGARLLKELQETGLVLSDRQRRILHIPAGLDLGAEAPEAIALSMLAEIQAALAGHSGASLRDRAGAIHQPSGPRAAN